VIERFYRWRRNVGGAKPPIHIKPHIYKTTISTYPGHKGLALYTKQ